MHMKGQGNHRRSQSDVIPVVPTRSGRAGRRGRRDKIGQAVYGLGAVTLERLEQRTLFQAAPGIADVAVSQTAPTTKVISGTDFTYNITVINNGGDVAQNVQLTDIIPQNTTFVSLTQTGGPAFAVQTPTKGQDGQITASEVGLAPGASATFALVVHVPSSVPAATVIMNTSSVTTDSQDPIPANNAAQTSVTTDVAADVGVTFSSFTGSPVYESQNLVYTLTVTDNGPSDAQGASFNFPLPKGTYYEGITQTSGPKFNIVLSSPPPQTAIRNISGSITTLPASTSGTFQILIGVAEAMPVTSTVTVTNSVFDPNTTNNTATDTHNVLDLPLVTTSHPDISAIAGKQITNVTVQTFTDLDQGLNVGGIIVDGPGDFTDYTATIDWGDGTAPTTGLLTIDPVGTFYVLGTHTYAKTGSYTIHSSVTEGAQQFPGIPAAVTDAYDAASVTSPELSTTPTIGLTSNENQNATLTLGTFTDPTGAARGLQLRRNDQLGRRLGTHHGHPRRQRRRVQCQRHPHLRLVRQLRRHLHPHQRGWPGRRQLLRHRRKRPERDRHAQEL